MSLSAGRVVAWTANVMDVPGHVLVFIGSHDAVLIDPFRGGRLLEPEQIATLMSASSMPERLVAQTAAMPNRAVLQIAPERGHQGG